MVIVAALGAGAQSHLDRRIWLSLGLLRIKPEITSLVGEQEAAQVRPEFLLLA
jgi:hypothetical protein